MKKIASLDIESCSTKQRAHIFEVGIVLANFTPNGIYYDPEDDDDEDHPASMLIRDRIGFTFDCIEQMLLGRIVDASTMKFHQTHRGDAARTMLMGSEQYPMRKLHEGFDLIRETLADVDQIWINGLSFDPALLRSLQEECEYPHDLWDFRKECDVRTIRTTNELMYELTHDSRKKSVHQALKDAEWNLGVANKYLNWTHAHQPKPRKVPGKIAPGPKAGSVAVGERAK